jgi:separase
MLADLENTLRTGPSSGSCGPFLLISLRLQWAFKKGRPSTQLLQDTIDEWSGLASEDQDWQISESHLDDPNFSFHQLQAVIDYTDMQGLSKLRLRALNLQHKLLESEKRNNPATLAMVLIRKGVQCNRLRFTDDAGRALASAKKCIDSLEPQPALSMEYHLALAEYLLCTSNLEGSLQALEVARSLYAAAFNFEIQNVHKRFDVFQAKTLCQSSSLISWWEFKSGNLNKAVFHAKRCVKLSSQIWAGTQKVQTSSQLPTAMRTIDSTIDGLSHDLSNMNISNHAANERSATRGAAFWPYVSIHCGALMHLSYLLANCGLYQDGIYYAEQAQLIAQAVDSQISIFVANTLLLAHRRKGNDINADLEIWNMKSPPPEAEEASISIVSNFVYLAEASVSAGDMVAASEAIDEATKCLSRIVLGYKPVPAISTTEKDHNEQVVPFLKNPKPKSRTKITSKNTRKAVQANSTDLRGKERSLGVNSAVKGEDTLLITFARLETTIDVLKAHIMLNSGRGEEAVLLLSNSEDAQVPVSVLVRSRLIQARTIMDDIFKNLSADVVHSVLAETTIAFPSLQKEHPFGKHAILESPLATKTYGRTHRSGAANYRKPMHHGAGFEKPSDLAIRAAELLLDVNIQQLGSCSTDMLRELSLMLNQCFMLSSVLMRQRNFTPVQVALQAALPHCSAMARERTVIMTDVALTNESNITSWPEIAPADTRTALLTSADVSLIEPGFLDKLPEQWNIVSMRLSRTRDEFSITKFHVGQPPFSLRIPLRRSSPDNDGVDFGFPAAKMELLDIIKTANKTAHDARGQSDKEAKRSWWTEREALDDRLRLLLENIENIWLGGFRGILAHQHRHQDLISRFSESFLQILNHHLPSRQKGRKATGACSNLHTHVLDLFVALGHPDEHELEDSIADLLYFVVDILQFQGEHNAYDEIDFDIVTVEVLDALRCYHEAIRALGVEHPQHTILILDKELLVFPWESLPCLDGRAVSRMPSLNCVESRLDKMRVQGVDGSAFSISTSRGAYILNPSSDLASTQSTFTAAFSTSLPNFSSIINRVPTEAEFESYLREKELFLYFGHGSGAQYIRGRNIKRLERCAVTFLMGCSSGKMVECGEFEPYGVPWNYMHANAPAVVGTLWDVTDKDIDRFAMKTFTEWGLLGGETSPEEAAGPKKRSKNVKGMGKSVKQPSQPSPDGATPEQKIALDEAVANARSSCVLRYLNGAAPVIYGIPIVLV